MWGNDVGGVHRLVVAVLGRLGVGESLDLQRFGCADERGQRLVLDVHLAAVDEGDEVLEGRVRDVWQDD